MHAKLHSVLTFAKRLIFSLSVICSTYGIAGSAQAVTINFDDLVFTPSDSEFDCWCDHPITDQYVSQGLLIEDGYLARTEYLDDPAHAVSPPNYLMGGNILQLKFVGALPTFVGMYVNSFFEESIYLNALDGAGQVTAAKTSGWAGPFDDTPYQPNQYVSFTSPLGFSQITVEGFYNMRVSAAIDDLTYEYASVPEPSTLILLGVGLLCFACLRLRVRSSKQ